MSVCVCMRARAKGRVTEYLVAAQDVPYLRAKQSAKIIFGGFVFADALVWKVAPQRGQPIMHRSLAA